MLGIARYFYHYFWAFVSSVFYGDPSQDLYVIGVTGTKGKSTTIDMIAAGLECAGKRVATLSSVRRKIGEKNDLNVTGNTMPGRMYIQKFLRDAVRANAEYAVIEVTSQGVVQHRHRFIEWDAGVFLNLSPEHIESHGSFEKYRSAKIAFFSYLVHSKKQKKEFFINSEDKNSSYFYDAVKNIMGGTIHEFRPQSFKEKHALSLQENSWISSSFNMENASAAYAVCTLLGVSEAELVSAFRGMRGVPGRYQVVQDGPVRVIVDYAHTPDSLRTLYENVRAGMQKGKRLICLLGSAGGGRDTWKRPEMGNIAGQLCDYVILTNEDPFDENPEKILDDVERGVKGAGGLYARIIERRDAIKKAVEIAEPGDVIVATGKGSEKYIRTAGGKREPWDEVEEFQKILS